MSLIVDVSAIESQNRVDMENYLASPPAIDLVIEKIASGAVTLKAISPDTSVSTFEYQVDAAGWVSSGVFTGLGAGAAVFQARDQATPATVSQTLTITVPA